MDQFTCSGTSCNLTCKSGHSGVENDFHLSSQLKLKYKLLQKIRISKVFFYDRHFWVISSINYFIWFIIWIQITIITLGGVVISNETQMMMMYGTKRQILVGDQLEARKNYQFMSYVLAEIGTERMIKNIILMLAKVQLENLRIRIKKRRRIERTQESLEEGQTGDQIKTKILTLKITFIITEINKGL